LPVGPSHSLIPTKTPLIWNQFSGSGPFRSISFFRVFFFASLVKSAFRLGLGY
jgi:hypothetical protein